MTERRVAGSVAVAVGVAAALYAFTLAHGMFVFTEARWFIHTAWPGDLARFFLFPILDWGNGRLLGMTVFQMTGATCGIDTTCTNGVASLLVGIAAAVLVAHTWQFSRSWPITLTAAGLWLVSAPVLGILVWQATWFDIVAFTAAIVAAAFWWDAFGRTSMSRRRAVTTAAVSVLLLALAFNAKEGDYYLTGVIVLLAVLRGWSSRVRRNLAIAAVPVAYALWFMAYGLTHAAPGYLEHSGRIPFGLNVPYLLEQSVGLGPSFMFLWQVTPPFQAIQRVALVGFGVWAVALAVGVVLALRRKRGTFLRPRPVAEIYLASIAVVTLFVFARSEGAAAYYLTIPYWALLVLGLLITRRVAAAFPRPRVAAVALVLLFAASTLTAYASLIVTNRSGYRQLADASSRVDLLQGQVRTALAGRQVLSVVWRTEGSPPDAYYVLRDMTTGQAGRDLFAYLLDGSMPPVKALNSGTAAELAARVSEFAKPGEVLVVTSEDYRLELLAYEGAVLNHGSP